MTPKHEFETEKDYLDYLKTYFSAKALTGLLLNLDFDNEADLAKKAVEVAELMIKQLFGSNDTKLPSEGKSPVIEEKVPKPIKVISASEKLKADIAEIVSTGSELFKKKAYQSALTEYKKALVLSPESKIIIAEIEKCNKWIRAVAGLNKIETPEKPFEETKRFKVEPQQKEEFTTSFPELE